MDPRIIVMDLVQANENLEYAKNAYRTAKQSYADGEISQATFDKVCEKAINADIALCDAMLIASKNGLQSNEIEVIIGKASGKKNA